MSSSGRARRQKLRVLVFDDLMPQVESIEKYVQDEITFRAGLYGAEVDVLSSNYPDIVPIGGESHVPLTEKTAIQYLRDFDAIVVDLQMKFQNDDTYIGEGSKCRDFLLGAYAREFGGFYAIEMAIHAGVASRVIVNSGNVENVLNSKSISGAQNALEYYAQKGVTLCRKGRPDSVELRMHLFSLLHLGLGGHIVDPAHRRRLLEVAHSGVASLNPHHVLILGETGTGKEWTARHIHALSWHYAQLMKDTHMTGEGVSTNVTPEMLTILGGSLLDNLARGELFGYIREAYTDAKFARLGRILEAFSWRNAKSQGLSQTDIEAINKSIQSAIMSRNTLGNPTIEKIEKLQQRLAEFITIWDSATKRFNSEKTSGNVGNKPLAPDIEYEGMLSGTGIFIQDEHTGKWEIQSDGPFLTIFIDEFADLTPGTQQLLLRFIEDGEFEPLGFSHDVSLRDENGRLHIRVIAATNRTEVWNQFSASPRAKGNSDFRLDLAMRVAQQVVTLVPMKLPSEPNEPSEVEWICRQIAKDNKIEFGALFPGPAIKHLEGRIEEDTKKRLTGSRPSNFPGNRRQFVTLIRTAVEIAKDRSQHPIGVVERPDFAVTEDLLKEVLRPIKPRANAVEDDPMSIAQDKIRYDPTELVPHEKGLLALDFIVSKTGRPSKKDDQTLAQNASRYLLKRDYDYFWIALLCHYVTTQSTRINSVELCSLIDCALQSSSINENGIREACKALIGILNSSEEGMKWDTLFEIYTGDVLKEKPSTNGLELHADYPHFARWDDKSFESTFLLLGQKSAQAKRWYLELKDLIQSMNRPKNEP